MRFDGRPAGAERLDADAGGGVIGIIVISGAPESCGSGSVSVAFGGVESFADAAWPAGEGVVPGDESLLDDGRCSSLASALTRWLDVLAVSVCCVGGSLV
jgi:hypothetical protein